MKFLKKVPYKAKTILPALALAGGAMMASCEKEEPVVKEVPAPSINTDDETNKQKDYVEFNIIYESTLPLFKTSSEGVKIVTDAVNYYIRKDEIKYIYIVPTGNWEFCEKIGIKTLREYTLEFMINYSPKIRGKGDFAFQPGEASKVPEDSLWYVQNGWTINKALQNQK